MNEWLNNAVQEWSDHQMPVADVARRLVVAFVLGVAIAGIYRWTHGRDEPASPTMFTTLVMLAVLIALVTQVIGSNVARAFSLAGALAIIRFRTIVEDTRDTAFVIFAVVIGMTVGAGYVLVALAGMVVAGLAATIMRPRGRERGLSGKYWALSIRVGITAGPGPALDPVLDKFLLERQQLSAATGRQGAALDLTFRVRLRPAASGTAMVSELNQLEGVQSVELRLL